MNVLEVEHTGLGLSLQDKGRTGWKQYGVPPGGAMDHHAARWANRLVGNRDDAAVLEMLMQGARLRVLADCLLAHWEAKIFRAGDVLHFPENQSGLWSYLGVAGGFDERPFLGSRAASPRSGIGRILQPGSVLKALTPSEPLPSSIAGRHVRPTEKRDYHQPPPLLIWPGPQKDHFPGEAWDQLLTTAWQVSPRSDRTGYRLQGGALPPSGQEMISEPVLTGSIQIPPGGEPIVTMRDGPTVGGYPKIALVDRDSLDWLAQCRPGVHFRLQAAV
jgi:biotin-dependent carboxylase-like uncharacterized protein